MTDASADRIVSDHSEAALRDAVARGDVAAAAIAPVLRHLLASEDNSLFGEEIVARVRGMVGDLARQLLDQVAIAKGEAEWRRHEEARVTALMAAIVEDRALLTHVHAQAIEWQVADRLHKQSSLDPVLPSLLQKLVSSNDGDLAGLAMHVLASQARWRQTQRRMQLRLRELPGDLLHSVVESMQRTVGPNSGASEAAAAIRAGYDEGGARIGLLSRLVASAHDEAAAMLRIAESGVGLFLTALAIATNQDRDRVVLSVHESQGARLALSLRAAGLDVADVESQIFALNPDASPPSGCADLSIDRAAALLADAAECGEG